MFQIALDFARRFDTLKKVCNNRKVFFMGDDGECHCSLTYFPDLN